MLAQTATGVADALDRLGGRRCSRPSSTAPGCRSTAPATTVSIYTRSLDDVTARLPEVVEATLALPVTDLIADGEAIALRPDGRPHRFQVTASRFGAARRRARLAGTPDRCRCSSSTCCTSTASTCSTCPPTSALAAARRDRAGRPAGGPAAHLRRRRGAAVPRRDAGGGPRGRDGEIADRAVRGGHAAARAG